MTNLTNPNALNQAAFSALSAVEIQQIPTSALGGLDKNHYRWLTKTQVAAMSTQQIAALAHPDWLPPAAVSGLTAQQVAAISISWYWMSADWLNALSPAAFAGIPPAGIEQLSDAAVKGLGKADVSAMTAQQAAALLHPELLSPAAVSGLTPSAVAAIAPQAWGKVSSDSLNALTPAAFAALPPSAIANLSAAAVRGLPDASVQSMTAAQFAAIADTDWVPLSAAAKLKPEQLKLATDWDSASARWLNALSTDAFAAIPAAGINQMSLAALQGLDATRRAIALKSADEVHTGYLDMASKDASINYDSVLTKLQTMTAGIGAGGLSAAQFDAFNNTLASARSATGDPSYVSSLMGCMLRDGVQVNMSADAFKQSVDKWFLGSNSATADSYVDVSDQPLFAGSIQQATNRLAQGGLGDCWLISSLEDIAADAPERLNGLISANGNGTYAVKFFNGGTDPVFVTVDGKVANYGAGTDAGGWARLVEEAYVSACASGMLQGNGYDTPWANKTDQLDGGVPAYALRTIAGGHDYTNYESGADAWEAVKAALESGSGLVSYASSDKVSTGSDGKTNLVGSHAFSVIGVDETNHKFIFRNPWSADLVFELSPQELDAIAGSGEFTVIATPADYGSAVAHFAGVDWTGVSADWINGQTPAMIAAITPQALSQLSAATVQGLSATTLQHLGTQQLASLSHLDQLTASAITGLSEDQFSALGPDWFNALSPAAVAALPIEAIRNLSTETVAGLSPTMVHALTPQQVAAIAHPDKLSAAAFGGLTAAQVPSILVSWYWMSATQINAMPPAAIAALSAQAIKDIESSGAGRGLSASTIHAMTAQQIGAMAHPDWLSASAFSGMTAAQVPAIAISWGWMSADQLNALSPDAFAAIPAAGVNQMTQASLQGLDATHHDLALKRADATHAGYLAPAPVPTGSAAPLVQAMAGFNVPPPVTTGAHGHPGTHSPYTLVKAH
ncbi:C2 family cysteine protease [Roseateles sp. L2-2]|uniref:C2 family cysteine protease n=1 Tax=Roseateles sp. L2-2 TaxID=3422597 RepID=UPI003D3600F9